MLLAPVCLYMILGDIFLASAEREGAQEIPERATGYNIYPEAKRKENWESQDGLGEHFKRADDEFEEREKVNKNEHTYTDAMWLYKDAIPQQLDGEKYSELCAENSFVKVAKDQPKKDKWKQAEQDQLLKKAEVGTVVLNQAFRMGFYYQVVASDAEKVYHTLETSGVSIDDFVGIIWECIGLQDQQHCQGKIRLKAEFVHGKSEAGRHKSAGGKKESIVCVVPNSREYWKEVDEDEVQNRACCPWGEPMRMHRSPLLNCKCTCPEVPDYHQELYDIQETAKMARGRSVEEFIKQQLGLDTDANAENYTAGNGMKHINGLIEGKGGVKEQIEKTHDAMKKPLEIPERKADGSVAASEEIPLFNIEDTGPEPKIISKSDDMDSQDANVQIENPRKPISMNENIVNELASNIMFVQDEAFRMKMMAEEQLLRCTHILLAGCRDCHKNLQEEIQELQDRIDKYYQTKGSAGKVTGHVKKTKKKKVPPSAKEVTKKGKGSDELREEVDEEMERLLKEFQKKWRLEKAAIDELKKKPKQLQKFILKQKRIVKASLEDTLDPNVGLRNLVKDVEKLKKSSVENQEPQKRYQITHDMCKDEEHNGFCLEEYRRYISVSDNSTLRSNPAPTKYSQIEEMFKKKWIDACCFVTCAIMVTPIEGEDGTLVPPGCTQFCSTGEEQRTREREPVRQEEESELAKMFEKFKVG